MPQTSEVVTLAKKLQRLQSQEAKREQALEEIRLEIAAVKADIKRLTE